MVNLEATCRTFKVLTSPVHVANLIRFS
uniref:Uncharacterized protein n=1 Tax=Arundo donax TaxID=35708 RepID=A0A0A9B4L1_ARUDO